LFNSSEAGCSSGITTSLVGAVITSSFVFSRAASFVITSSFLISPVGTSSGLFY